MTIKEIRVQLALGTLTDNMKYKLANDERTSKKILTILSTDENWVVRYKVARNPNTPVEVLTILSKDEDSIVRCWVANNPNTPVEVAVKL